MKIGIFEKIKRIGNKTDKFLAENNIMIARIMEVVFGSIWFADATFLLRPNFIVVFTSIISKGGIGQPSYLSGWFNFWSGLILPNAYFFMYLMAFLEFTIAISLILGFGRKISYVGGFIFSILLWAVPEGFGGPYNTAEVDVGIGIIYAVVFTFLMITSSIHGRNKYTLDYYIEKKVDKWKYIAEVNY